MRKKQLKYYAFLGVFNSSGILQKIENTVEAASNIGYVAEKKFYVNRPAGLFEFIKDITCGKEDVVILRLYDLFMPFIFPFLLFRRLKGTRLIIDVPTPRVTQMHEFHFDNKSNQHVVIRKLLNYLSCTWVLIPFHRIIQYAEESPWFSFGVKNKTVKMGNGIKINDQLVLADRTPVSERVNLIAVATLSAWHGYDRLIKAVARLKEKIPDYPIHIKIVGEGQAFSELKELITIYKLKSSITLTGALHGKELTKAFEGMQFGVSSLGLFRKGLEEASDLKTREYMARGLCVIGVGRDPDFTEDSPYRFLVSNDESIESIVELLLSLKDRELPSSQDVRSYAEKYLTYDAKIKKIIG